VAAIDGAALESARALLRGAIETHVHSSPDVVPRRSGDVELVRAAAEAGMRAVVLKSHHTATGDRAQLAAAQVPGISVFGGVALDEAVGGLNPAAVEASARLGGTVVWLPTTTSTTFLSWMADQTVDHPFGAARQGVAVLDAHGRPLRALLAVLDAVAEHDQVLATGHLGRLEIEVVVDEALVRGIDRIVVTHPEHPYIELPHAAQRELAARGVWFERCYLVFPEQEGNAEPVATAMSEVGAASTILATDFGQARNLDPVDGYVAYLAELLELGVPEADLRLASTTNPAKLLRLDG
jgi:hypothetical protein